MRDFQPSLLQLLEEPSGQRRAFRGQIYLQKVRHFRIGRFLWILDCRMLICRQDFQLHRRSLRGIRVRTTTIDCIKFLRYIINSKSGIESVIDVEEWEGYAMPTQGMLICFLLQMFLETTVYESRDMARSSAWGAVIIQGE